MTSIVSRQTVAFAALGLLLAVETGCVPVVYAIPKSHTFSVADLNAPDDQVHVFRQRDSKLGRVCGADSKFDVALLEQPNKSSNFSQKDVTLDAKILLRRVVIEAWEDGWSAESYEVLRLYRPGYRVVTLRSGDSNKLDRLEWIPANTLGEQEAAVDRTILLPSPPSNCTLYGSDDDDESKEPRAAPIDIPDNRGWDDGFYLAKRGRSAIAFACTEYRRIAAQVEAVQTGKDRQDSLDRLRAKVAWLQSHGPGILAWRP